MVEKCFTVSTEEANRVLEAQKKSGKVLTVFQSESARHRVIGSMNDTLLNGSDRRYDSDFLTLQKVLNQGVLGRVCECEIHYDQDRPPAEATPYAPGGGMLFGIGSHTIDQVGDSPRSDG